jgi:hypothetical protein
VFNRLSSRTASYTQDKPCLEKPKKKKKKKERKKKTPRTIHT